MHLPFFSFLILLKISNGLVLPSLRDLFLDEVNLLNESRRLPRFLRKAHGLLEEIVEAYVIAKFN